VAVDATARLYDVDEDSVIFSKLDRTEKYDQGIVTFRARSGKLIDLGKLHESIWATRLSGGTRSGLVSLEVNAIGQAINTQDATILRVNGSDAKFVLVKHSSGEYATAFEELLEAAAGEKPVAVTGVIDNYRGRWPQVLRAKPDKTRRILVTGFQVVE
jgi:hypothetical protein